MSSIATRALPKALAIVLALLAACGDSNSVIVDPPPVRVASVVVTPDAQELIVGQQLTLEAKPKAADGKDLEREVVWTSENTSLATVTETGVVTALAVGQAYIRATSEGKFGRAVLTIRPVPPVPVAEVRLSVDEEIVLEWDGITQITATAYDAQGNVLIDRHVQWSSNRPSVAAVVNGTVEAQNPGTATITATVEGIVASVGVRVNQAPIVALHIEALTTGLEIGETFLFGSRIERANGENLYGPVSWTSSAPAIGRIAHSDISYGVVEALSEGTFTLTATREGFTTSMTLTVSKRPTHDLIYNRWENGTSEIFTFALGTADGVPVRINAGNVSRQPSPSPDGTQLVFAVSQTLPNGELQNDLYVVSRNGQNMRWLTRMPGLEDDPAWSPDGTKILFHATDENHRSDIYVVDAVDGGGLTNLTAFIGAEMYAKRHPAWSPDGKRVAFVGGVNGNHKVYTMAADGSDLRQITTDAGYDDSPTFSPDGTKIAFVRYNAASPGYGDDIMIVPSAGGAPVRLTLAGDQRSPVWSPDGKFIAVSGTPVASTGKAQIYTMRADGTGLRLRTVDPAWGGGVSPAWIARP